MAIKHVFIVTILKTKDLFYIWQAMKNIYEVRESSQILLLTTYLYNMQMTKRELIEKYLCNARNLKSKLVAMDHKVADETLVQLTLNKLPSSQ